MFNVNVHYSTSRKCLNKWMTEVCNNLNKSQDFLDNDWCCLTLMQSAMHSENQPTNTAFQQKHLTPVVKHVSRGVMIYFILFLFSFGDLVNEFLSQSTSLWKSILEENVRLLVRLLRLHQNWVMRRKNDLKYTDKSTSKWLKKNKNSRFYDPNSQKRKKMLLRWSVKK